MDTEFLDEIRREMDGEERFSAVPWYNRYGDCVVFHTCEEAGYADRVDGILTIYRSLEDDRAIGFQVKGVKALLRKFGYDGIEVAAAAEGDRVQKITISMLLAWAVTDRRPAWQETEAYMEAGALAGPRAREAVAI